MVTGGAGFIGQYLTGFLLDKHKVVIYDNLSNDSKETLDFLIKKGVHFIKGDILDYDTLVKSSKGFDVVIHLAAKTDVVDSVLHPEETYKVNVDGTNNVVRVCIENNIKKIIFSSSAAVYGDSDVPINEKMETKPRSPYGKSKKMAEEKIKAVNGNNLDYIILRLFNVYGKKQNSKYAGVISNFLQNILKENPLVIYGEGKQTRDFISIADTIYAFDCAIKTDSIGTYNIASGKSISIIELSKILESVFKKKIKVIYENARKDDIIHSQADIALARKELGFKPKINLKNGLLDLISISN